MTSKAQKTAPAKRRPTHVLLHVRVPERLNDQLLAIANRENNGISSVMRRLLTDAIQREASA